MGDQSKTQPVGFLVRRNGGAPPAPVENSGLPAAAPVPEAPPASFLSGQQKLPSIGNIPAAPAAPASFLSGQQKMAPAAPAAPASFLSGQQKMQSVANIPAAPSAPPTAQRGLPAGGKLSALLKQSAITPAASGPRMSAIRPNVSALIPAAKQGKSPVPPVPAAPAPVPPVAGHGNDGRDPARRVWRPAESRQASAKGLDHYDRGEFNLALDMYEDAVKADPTFAMAYNNKGMVLIDLERNEEALSALCDAVARDDNYGEAYNNLGFVLRRLGDNLQAAAAYKKFLEIEPDVEDGSRIQQWVDSVKADHGVTELPALKLTAPTNPGTLLKAQAAELPKVQKMAAWQVAAGDVATAAPLDALGQYASQTNLKPLGTQATGRFPLQGGMESSPGMSSVPAPMRSGAFNILKSAKLPALKTVNATPEESRNRIAALVENSLDKFADGNLDEALKLAHQALDFDVDNHEVHTALGKILVRQEKLEEGIKHLERAIQLCPSDPAAYYVLGFTLRARERNVEAAEIYEKFLELMPDATDAAKMRQWVKHVKGIAEADDTSGPADDGYIDHEGRFSLRRTNFIATRFSRLTRSRWLNRSPNARSFSKNIPIIPARICCWGARCSSMPNSRKPKRVSSAHWNSIPRIRKRCISRARPPRKPATAPRR